MRVLVACHEEGVRFGDEDAGFMGKWVVIVLEEELEFRAVSQYSVRGLVVDLERGGVSGHLAEASIRIDLECLVLNAVVDAEALQSRRDIEAICRPIAAPTAVSECPGMCKYPEAIAERTSRTNELAGGNSYVNALRCSRRAGLDQWQHRARSASVSSNHTCHGTWVASR